MRRVLKGSKLPAKRAKTFWELSFGYPVMANNALGEKHKRPMKPGRGYVRPNNCPVASRGLLKRITRRLARAEVVWHNSFWGNLGQNRKFPVKSVLRAFVFCSAGLTLPSRGSFDPLGSTWRRGRESARFECTFHGEFPILARIFPMIVRPNNCPSASRLLLKRITRHSARAEGVWPYRFWGNLGQNREFPVKSVLGAFGFRSAVLTLALGIF